MRQTDINEASLSRTMIYKWIEYNRMSVQ